MLLKSNLLYCFVNKEISSLFSKFCSGALYFHLIEKRESLRGDISVQFPELSFIELCNRVLIRTCLNCKQVGL